MITRRSVEKDIAAGPSARECISYLGRTYVQVDACPTSRGAKSCVARLHSWGYLARVSPLTYGKKKYYLVFARHAPKKEVHYFMSNMDFHSGTSDPRATYRRTRVVKGE